jgi:hypothetical protein
VETREREERRENKVEGRWALSGYHVGQIHVEADRSGRQQTADRSASTQIDRRFVLEMGRDALTEEET